jgi:SAM-dependent methyltransferase
MRTTRFRTVTERLLSLLRCSRIAPPGGIGSSDSFSIRLRTPFMRDNDVVRQSSNGLSHSELLKYLEWDVTTWSAGLTFWSQHSLKSLPNAHVLELGARNGGLSLWLAVNGAHVLSTDVDGPSDRAKVLHVDHNMQSRVSYEAVDATTMEFDSEFDVVVFKSVLGGVGGALGHRGQQEVIKRCIRSLKPGGELWFAENLTGTRLIGWLRNRFVPWGSRWRYVTTGELLSWLEEFDQVETKAVGTVALLGRNEKQRRRLAKLDRRVLDHFGGDNARYVLVGVARKIGGDKLDGRSESADGSGR